MTITEPLVEEAITLVELQKDLRELTLGLASLQRQVASQIGAIQYIEKKITELTHSKEM